MSEYAKIIFKFYDYQAVTLKEVFDLVTERKITKEEFHSITELNYNVIKKCRGW